MDAQWKFRRLGHDEPQRVAVGDPDPTLDAGMADGSGTCRFEWEEITGTLILLWCCTRELGHHGQHLAGTGECVAAVQAAPPDAPITARGCCRSRAGVAQKGGITALRYLTWACWIVT